MTRYSEKLKDPRWQRRKTEILQAADFQCCDCGATDKTLHVHHVWYEYGREPWEYPDDALVVLCGECHEQAEEERRYFAKVSRQLSIADIPQVIGYIEAMVAHQKGERPVDLRGLLVRTYEQAAGIADYFGIPRAEWVIAMATDSVARREGYRDGSFIPTAATWLMNRMWEENPPGDIRHDRRRGWFAIPKELSDAAKEATTT